MYKSLLPLNEKCIFENIHLVVVKMKSGTMEVVSMKFPHHISRKSHLIIIKIKRYIYI